MAHLLLVNSRFTSSVFAQTFSRLHARGVVPQVRAAVQLPGGALAGLPPALTCPHCTWCGPLLQVLYPCVALPPVAELAEAARQWRSDLGGDLAPFIAAGPTLLSINRCGARTLLACTCFWLLWCACAGATCPAPGKR